MSGERESISRPDFAAAVRAAEDRERLRHAHHPRPGEYDPRSFRHYVRERAVMRALGPLEFASVLDVGCSEGYFMKVIADRRGAEVWGIDISTEGLVKAREVYGQPVASADAHRLPFADGSFDLVMSTETLEHVLDPEVMVAEMKRVARRHILVTTPISETADAHEPDFALEQEGHVNNFDPATIRTLFGSQARIASFRCNATFAFIYGAGRRLPRPLREASYALDGLLSRTLGSPTHPLKPLRNRDWLILAPGDGAGGGSPEWRCPRCRGALRNEGEAVVCEACGVSYAVRQGVPDFFLQPAGG